MRRYALFGLSGVWMALSASTAVAADLETLARIKQTGAVAIGYRESSIPFSYLDQDGKPIGYSIDICHRIVDALKATLAMPALQPRYKLVTPGDRIEMVKNGSVDLECGSTTNNLERQREVAFSLTTFIAANRLLVKKSSGARILLNLKNKPVVSTAGTTSLKLLIEHNERDHYNMKILTARDHAEAFAMVEDGRAAAFSLDDILLASLIANSKAPDDYALIGQPLSVEPYGIMLRRGDPAFKKEVDETIKKLFYSGELHKIYAKWFTSPIPPKGVNLNVPMGALLEKVVRRPTDSGNPASYH